MMYGIRILGRNGRGNMPELPAGEWLAAYDLVTGQVTTSPDPGQAIYFTNTRAAKAFAGVPDASGKAALTYYTIEIAPLPMEVEQSIRIDKRGTPWQTI